MASSFTYNALVVTNNNAAPFYCKRSGNCEAVAGRPVHCLGGSYGSRVDADAEIEQAAGKSVPDIFRDHGEASFREGERRVIARLLESGPKVLATGGGAFMNEETRKNISRLGIAVWLKADIELLMKRVRRRDNRPLLKADNPEEIMQTLIEQRYPVYGRADIIVESRDVPHSSIVSDVIRALAAYQRARKAAERIA
jgi:shikimate kinase